MTDKIRKDLDALGITNVKEIHYNPSYEDLFKYEMDPSLTGYDKGQLTELDAINVMTGIYTGRSPKDKYIVMDKESKNTVWWTTPEYKNDNHPMSEEVWAQMKDLAKKELCNKELYVVDAFCGANKDTRIAVRFIMEVAWQAHFVRNMFIKPTDEELKDFTPSFTVYTASKAKVENYKELGLNSETCVAFNVTTREQVILNTWYGGEMKKGMFSMMNYYLPLQGIAAMHCSANTDMEGKNTAIFFGLSGTGKTTLSTDPKRLLIGDDEHGWDDEGVFNFEGGCYAKVINLDKDSEPDIYNAIRRNALLENVTVDANGKIDFADKSVTENTRVSYPIDHIEKIVRPISASPAAKNVIFLITGNAIELFGKEIRDEDRRIECLGLFDFYSVRYMKRERHNSQFIGHYGDLTMLGHRSQFSFAYGDFDNNFIDIERGIGMNPDTQKEGIHVNNFFATYSLGPFLILNPYFTKEILGRLGLDQKLCFEKEIIEAYDYRLAELRRTINAGGRL